MCKVVYGVALTRYPLSIHFHRIWGQKMTKFTKWKKWQKLIQWLYISKPHAHVQTMEKTCAKFQKDWYKIVWGVALTRYPLSIHSHRIWSQNMTKFTKWKRAKNYCKDCFGSTLVAPTCLSENLGTVFQLSSLRDWMSQLRKHSQPPTMICKSSQISLF